MHRLYCMTTYYSKTKIIFITIACTFVFTFILLFGGCYGMHKIILSKRTCEFSNIDNYELRTFTDISGTEDSDCNYDEEKGVKSTIFKLKLTEQKLINNIGYNNFKKLSECTLHPFKYNPAWNDSIAKLPQEHLYTKAGRYKADSWIYVLDSVNQVLWAELVEDRNYKDED